MSKKHTHIGWNEKVNHGGDITSTELVHEYHALMGLEHDLFLDFKPEKRPSGWKISSQQSLYSGIVVCIKI